MATVKIQRLSKMDASTSIAVLVTVSDLELHSVDAGAIADQAALEIAQALVREREYAKDKG